MPKAVANTLYMSDNGKTKFRSNHRNTFGLNFGLPANGGTCPGATLGKGGCLDVRDGLKRPTCYMAKVTQIYKAVGAKLQFNTDLLANKSTEEMKDVMRRTVQAFVDENDRSAWFVRMHYSGDFFSADYARAWADVINEFPEVRFWVYTRSHDMVQFLVDCKNLTVFMSVDPVNKDQCLAIYEQYRDKPNLGLAWLGPDAPVDHRWVVCPETSGVVKNTKDQGACARCRLCIDRYKSKVRNIQFQIH